ncbi:HotDog domain-containing protein [Phycomyces nitens]|nr:HotDog domain-containing protein [Phycomyces nitens]
MMFSRILGQTAKGINRRPAKLAVQARFFTHQNQKQVRSRFSPLFISTTSAIVATGITFAVMSTQHHEALLDQKISLNGTADHQLEEATAYLNNMAIVKQCRLDRDMFEIEAYGHLKGSAKLHSLTASTLRGKGKLIVAPVIFYNKSMTQVTIVCHLGTELCGHDGIIHGGMLATLLDEVLACVAFPALPNNIGFTANLNIDYRKPVKSDQWVVLRGKLDRLDGRKAFVEAWIEDLEGTKMTEAKSLYVAPKSIIQKIGS